jgi:pimeloyl-ACP methyl ester carboxylesterase
VIPAGHESNDLQHAILEKYCKSCFQNKSTVNFDRTYDVVEGTSGTIFVFVHGGSGCRAMFQAHAAELQQRFGHGSILLDLPGHGSLVETPLSLATCAETLGNVFKECGIMDRKSDRKVIYVGGSIGAYIGFYLLQQFQEVVDGAILMDCGQNVGPGASFKAKLGLVVLKWLGSSCSNATLLKMMRDVSAKSDADYHIMETVFGAGMFFDRAGEQVECLRAVAPAEFIPNLDLAIIFMNGSEDYRDSEQVWLELCKNKKSELKVYQGGDHFFIHDSRFVDDILNRCNDLANKI